MMKMLYNKQIFSAIALLAAMVIHVGCMDDIEETIYSPDENVSFKTSFVNTGRTLQTKGLVGSCDYIEEEWVINSNETKASLYNTLNEAKTAGVYGYIYNGEWSSDFLPLSGLIDGHKYIFDGDELSAEKPVRWSTVEHGVADKSKIRVFAYAPLEALIPTYQTPATEDVLAKGAPVINIPDVLEKNEQGKYVYQTDILVADHETQFDMDSKSHRKEIPLEFEHIFTALQFKAGFECTITDISITGPLVTGGQYVIGEGWSNLVRDSEIVTVNPAKGNNDDVLMMIPQQIPVDDPDKVEDDVVITLTYSIDGGTQTTVSAKLNGVEWKQGKKITYTLKRESDNIYVYLDLAAGNVAITDNRYTGYVYKNGSKVTVTGTLSVGQEYYIYQSCITDINKESSNYKVGWSGDSFTLPSYPPVYYNGQLWSDYITNNTDVEAVISAWDNELGAGKATASYISSSLVNQSGAAGAVRDAGREATKNRIHITGNIGNVRMTIDNIYSSYQQRGSTPVRTRDKGGISFLPAQDGSNSILTIHIRGDNRLGCVNYQNYAHEDKNWLKFEGSGSLTVGDTDYFRDGSGLGSNRSCSVIGGKDEEKTEEDVFNIEFNSGVIYAGATPSSCTAIGGGGNGDTNIIINGGTITAVAKTTGTAIGGGTGLVQPGGKGNVTIRNGNVYAYNFKNSSNVPSAAIGAAGSQQAVGGDSKVNIEGGYVYAYSEYGTAIGGGSSAWRNAGKGIVNISGGTVIAKTGDRNSVGIGGGCAYTEEYKPKSTSSTKNGGDAQIKITGNPVIRTGSIGGGTPGMGESVGGKIGSANILIEGGDIQAQFVMADSPNNTFKMGNGVIRNSSTSDKEYYCVKPNGGAVYMEKGIFTMNGGTIKECYADKTESSKGGAVYIKGDSQTSFTMTGGEIRECRANADGGAVYLESGSVTISGGTIDGNVAYNGNGGAISIFGGSFTMNGESALISQNAAFDRGSGLNGNGGGIYIAPAPNSINRISVNLYKGKILKNSSDMFGGGVCVDMGGNDDAQLAVIVGETSQGAATDLLKIAENNALIKGGGMYVNGANATVTLNDGYVLDNQTSSYQVNPDMTVEGGLVTLMKPGITTQVTVTFNNNAQYYTQNDPAGQQEDIKVEQYIVAASLSELDACAFAAINEYYKNFKGWNTRRDGKGTSYTDSQVVSLDENITLYAQWSNK